MRLCASLYDTLFRGEFHIVPRSFHVSIGSFGGALPAPYQPPSAPEEDPEEATETFISSFWQPKPRHTMRRLPELITM